MASKPAESYGGCVSIRHLLARHGDLLLAGLIGVLYVAEVLFESDVAGHRLASALAAAAFSATLAQRRRAPLVVLLAGLAVIELDNTLLPGLAEAGAFLLGIVIALYSAGRHARGRTFAGCAAIVLAAIPLAAIEPGQPVGFSDFAFFGVFFAGPFVAGRIIRARREREQALIGHATALELEGDAKARDAVAEERARIARELHDVVAHAISVIVLQARGGRRVLDESPGETREALEVIEHAGEQALGEMRRLLGMLRKDDGELALAPQPSLARLGELAERLTASGLPVEVRIEGDAVELPPGIDVSAYRIVQEALTNALKHAGPARAQVIVRYAADEIELEVLDDGASNGMGGGTGHGLVGIRERVGIYGGELQSGRRPEGGYALRARLPIGSVR
jgi:signal transduction histidine kinase